MSDPYAEIRQLAKDETRLISAESYSTLRRFVLAALPVVEAANDWGCAECNVPMTDLLADYEIESCEMCEQLRAALAHLEEVTRGK